MYKYIYICGTMPLITSSYLPPKIFRNAHISTIYSAKLRSSPALKQLRERIHLPDGDFMDLDWSYAIKKTKKVAILLHGLEGNAQRTYIKAVANHLNRHEWDAVAVNYRGCSGETNKLYRSYNAGATEDLEAVIQSVLEENVYTEIALNGFSLGGNLMLKYLGENRTIPSEIKKAVAVSTPLSLEDSLGELNKWHNKVYATSFLLGLKKKYRMKIEQFPEKMTKEELNRIKSLFDFDNLYTSKAHGFNDAAEYYDKNSSLQYLPGIKIPVLLINAVNDSFLSPVCYPFEFAEKSSNFYLETPLYGGHVGFFAKNNFYYSEKRTVEFLNEHV